MSENIYHSLAERILKIRETHELSRRDLEKITGIPEYTWRAVETGKQVGNIDHITAIAKEWPQYKHWLVFGEEIPEAGQISPMTEAVRINLRKAG